MELLKTILVVLQIISAIGVIVLVLVQQGKGCLLYTSDAADE